MTKELKTMLEINNRCDTKEDNSALPKILHAHLITMNMIEIKFNKDVENASSLSNFKLTIDNKETTVAKISPYSFKTVTLMLKNNIDLPLTKKVEVELISDNIMDSEGQSVEKGVHNVIQKDYFTQLYISQTGIKIYAVKDIKLESLQKAGRMVDLMLNKRRDIANTITEKEGGLSILAYGEHAYMQPDLRFEYNPKYLYVEGFGGEVAQCTECNLERNKNFTHYPNESILVHEFAHTIHLTGIKNGDPEFFQRIEDTFAKVREEGKWEKTYSGSNPEEYFAVGTTLWFDVMSESKDGSFDGTRCAINTREELKEYDIDLYNILSDFYDDDKYFEAPWNKGSCPNLFNVHGELYV